MKHASRTHPDLLGALALILLLAFGMMACGGGAVPPRYSPAQDQARSTALLDRLASGVALVPEEIAELAGIIERLAAAADLSSWERLGLAALDTLGPLIGQLPGQAVAAWIEHNRPP